MNAFDLARLVDAPPWAVLLFKITAVLFVAWLVHWALSGANPRWRVLLWRVVAIALIALPAAAIFPPALNIRVARPAAFVDADSLAANPAAETLDAPLRMARQNRRVGQASPASDGPPFTEGAKPRVAAAPRLEAPATERTAVERLPQSAPKAIPKAAAAGFTWSTAAMTAWLCGVAVLLVRLAVGQFRLHQVLRLAVPPPEWVADEFRSAAAIIACHPHVQLLQTRAIETPLQCGLWRPRLLLPAAMCDVSHRGDLPAVFVHELSHVRAGDVRWSFLLHLISIALWPHPLVWRTRKAHLAACELVADAVSADVLGDVAGYCQTLARIALRAQNSLGAAGIGMARPSSISCRLQALRTRVFRAPLNRRRAVGTAALALLAVGALGVLRFAIAAPPTKPVASAEKVVIKPAAALPASPAATSMRLLVLDPEGKPLSGAEIVATIQSDEKDFMPSHSYKTGANGVAEIALPKSYSSVRIWVRKSAMAGMYAAWELEELAVIGQAPASFTIRLEPGTAAGGRIVDEQGRPIAGVKVRVSLQDNPRPANGDSHVRYNASLAENCVTDADGRWRINDVPKDDKVQLRIAVIHLDFVSDVNPGELQRLAHITTAMLRKETAVLALKRGIIVRGRVTDPAGKPIRGALVVSDVNISLDPSPDVPSVFPTDNDGRYRLLALPPRQASLTVIAPGWAAQRRNLTLQAGMAAQDFQMQPGKPKRLRFVDTAGKPVADVRVRILRWCEDQEPGFGQLLIDAQGKTYHNLDLGIPDHSDAGGVWEWKWGGPTMLTCFPNPAAKLVRTGLIMQNAGDRTVILKPEFHIKGQVVDAATGKPIPLFSYSLGQRSEQVSGPDGQAIITYSAATVVGRDGHFDYPWEYRENWPRDERSAKEKVQFDYRPNLPEPGDQSPHFRLQVEAIGYAPQTGPDFRVGEGPTPEQEFRLVPSSPISGQVVDTAGRPLGNVRVAMATGGVGFFYLDIDSKVFKCANTLTDAAGRFAFADPGVESALLVYGEAGFAQTRCPKGQHDVGRLTLRPWATIRGRANNAGLPLKNAMVELDPIHFGGLGAYYDPPPRIFVMLQTYSDAAGRFEFKRVPPIPFALLCGDSQPDHMDPTISPDQPTPAKSQQAAGRPETLAVTDINVVSGLIPTTPEPKVPASRPMVSLDPKPGEDIDVDFAGAGTVVITGKVKLPPHTSVPKDEGLRYSENFLIARTAGIAPLAEIADAGFDARKGWRRAWRTTGEGATYRASLRCWWVMLSADGEFRIYGVPPGEYDLAIDVTGYSTYGQLAQKVIRFTVRAEDAARGIRSLGEIPLDPPTIPKIGVSPVLRFERPDGTAGSLEDLRGHWTLVKFWAGWHRESGEYQALLQDLKKRHADHSLVSLDLSLDSDPAQWQAALRRLNPPGQQGRIGATGDGLVCRLPEYWLLDPAGKLVERVGAAEELSAEIEKSQKEEAEKSSRKSQDK